MFKIFFFTNLRYKFSIVSEDHQIFTTKNRAFSAGREKLPREFTKRGQEQLVEIVARMHTAPVLFVLSATEIVNVAEPPINIHSRDEVS